MERRGLGWGRIAFAAAAVAVCALLVAPASAFAHTATRIVVSRSSITCDWSTPGTTPVAPVITAKLQKRTSSGWVSLKGTIRVYMSTTTTPALTLLQHPLATSVRQTLKERGRYRFYYGGSSTMKPCVAYSTRYDRIGEQISLASVSFTDLDAAWRQVSLAYNISWNEEAFPVMAGDGPLSFSYRGTCENADLYSGDVFFDQDLWSTGVYRLSYLIPIADIPVDATFDTTARIESLDAYIVTRASAVNTSAIVTTN